MISCGINSPSSKPNYISLTGNNDNLNNNYGGNYSNFTPGSTSPQSGSNMADDWSHDVYIVNFNPSSSFNSYIKQLSSFNEWVYKKNPNVVVGYDKLNFQLPNKLQHYQKLHIEGEGINTDLVVEAY